MVLYLKVRNLKGDANKRNRIMDAAYMRINRMCEHCKLTYKIKSLPDEARSLLEVIIPEEDVSVFIMRTGFTINDLISAFGQHSETALLSYSMSSTSCE